MYKKFLNARSPLRLLERGLHGGLGAGNVGVVLAGHGVGKTSFLVGVALDDLLRGQKVLHITVDQTVAHLRAFYDTVFDELAASAHLEDEARVHVDVDRLRSIRAYPPDAFDTDKLREAVKLESEAGNPPAAIVVEGFEATSLPAEAVSGLKALAAELGAEAWVSLGCAQERIDGIPDSVKALGDEVSVVLALEPGQDAVRLRALKDHDNPDVEKLHVALDPRSLLLVRD